MEENITLPLALDNRKVSNEELENMLSHLGLEKEDIIFLTN